MAIVHRATLTPSKPELLHGWLDRDDALPDGAPHLVATWDGGSGTVAALA